MKRTFLLSFLALLVTAPTEEARVADLTTLTVSQGTVDLDFPEGLLFKSHSDDACQPCAWACGISNQEGACTVTCNAGYCAECDIGDIYT